MSNTTSNAFAAMVEPGPFAQAVAVSLQLNLLPKRQYSPLSETPRIGDPERLAIGDGDEAKGQDGADADRFDFVDTGAVGFIAVDRVRRVG